jgi:GWxTD domain-containing protein
MTKTYTDAQQSEYGQSENCEVLMVNLQHRRMNRIIGLILLGLAATSGFAELSPKFKEWNAGPAQWIMTSDEKRAWRKVTTDSDAIHFIDLFWVRRDPSPGTAINEFRNEFESRVVWADKAYGEKRRRGALTDRGRVYIVLGAGTNMNSELRQTNSQQNIAMGEGDGRQRGGRDIWLWEYEDARKFDMPKIEVVFVEDPITRRFQRDPTRADFGLAGPVAIKKAIVSPDLTAVPAWAPTGGLEPVAPLRIVEIPGSAAPSAPTEITREVLEGATSEDVKIDGPVAASKEPGVSRLTLLPGKWIESASSTDPFAGHTQTTFKSGADMRWAVQFCSAKAEVPRLKSMLLIVGPLDGGSKEQRTQQKDAKPEPMAAQPGCYVLQGPMPKLNAGRYKLSVLFDDSATGEIYDVKRELRVE